MDSTVEAEDSGTKGMEGVGVAAPVKVFSRSKF